MNQNLHITNQTELEQLIERYFDGETTLQEEQALKQALADCPWTSDTINEARFAMGYFTTHKQQQRHSAIVTMRRRAIGIAASIAVLLTIGGALLWQTQRPQDVCIAYVNGKAITSDDAVMALIEKDLNTMDNASNSMAAQLSSLGEALELDNN